MVQRSHEGNHLMAKIKMGDKTYSVPIAKSPYLASFVQRQKVAQPDATEFAHEPIKMFGVALKGLESGYRQCFRSLPIQVSQYQTLFETYQLLGIEILRGLSTDEVIANLKVGRSDYDPDERRRISGNKSVARDAAFQLLYLIIHAAETSNRQKLYNAVMFVVSHPGTFKPRTRRMIRLAYDQQMIPTMKQRQGLDRWDKGENTDDAVDETTEDEFDNYFDSDDSFL
jgi:hypothetical protein